MTDLVVQTSPEPGVAVLSLNRPDARNALDSALRNALAERFLSLAEDRDIRCVVVTGGPTIFAAGADLRAIATASALDMANSGLHRLWDVLAAFPKPVIAAVCGPALGAGCELAMHADLIVTAEDALWGQPEIKVGIMPGAGGVQRLVRLVGRTRAMRLLLTGTPIDGKTAYDWGLACDAVPSAKVLERALEYGAAIAQLPAASAAQIKEVARLGENLPLDAALAIERKSFWLMFGTADQKEGMAAFLEKRKPQFNQK